MKCRCCKGAKYFVTPSLFEGYPDHIAICTRCGGSGNEPGTVTNLYDSLVGLPE